MIKWFKNGYGVKPVKMADNRGHGLFTGKYTLRCSHWQVWYRGPSGEAQVVDRALSYRTALKRIREQDHLAV